MADQSDRQPLRTHLQELRRRLLWVVAVVVTGSIVGYLERQVIIDLLQRPLNQPLFYNSPSGGFDFAMRISLLVGIVLGLPFLIYHLIKFIQPALRTTIRRRHILKLFTLSVMLAALGLVFAYQIVIPMSLKFFASFGSLEVKPLISAKDYLAFVTACLTTFAVIFQLPLLLLFINRITPLPPRRLMRYQRQVIVGSLAAALILPITYDPLTMFVIATPIIVLYEFSIILLWIANRRRPDAPKPVPEAATPALEKTAQAHPQLLKPAPVDLSGWKDSPPETPMSRWVIDTRTSSSD